MKKIVLLVAFAIAGTTVTFAQEATKTEVKKEKKAKKSKEAIPTKVFDGAKPAAATTTAAQIEGAGMVFENETIDYGTIPHNADGKREFVFTNNGKKDLIISSTQGSCGCTVPTTPKDPIPPGGKGVIGVKYATDRVGAFTKTVTISSNAEGMPSKVVTIKGTVLPDPTPVTPAEPAIPAENKKS